MTITKITAAVAAGLAALALTGCGDDEETGSASTTATTAAADVTVTNAWARITAPTAKQGAVYMAIAAPEGDTLTSASVPTSIAGKTELHETTGGTGETMNPDEMTPEQMAEQMKKMRRVNSIEIPAGETVMLKPGGYHVMLLELADPIEEGETIPVTLEFERAGTVKVEATAKKMDM